MHATRFANRSGTTAGRPIQLSPSARMSPAALALGTSPRLALQRQAIGSTFGRHASVLQRVGHKPNKGQQIRYPATGPKEGAVYTVIDAQDNGHLQIKDAKGKTSNINWEHDKVWLVYGEDDKDVDMRMETGAWDDVEDKDAVYAKAKTHAIGKIVKFAEGGMINPTNKRRLKEAVVIGAFNPVKTGEWNMTWNETEDGDGSSKSKAKARKWKFTIDMDKPLATSWQEPHVGWEVKLIDPGANGSGKPYEGFAKQQGHVWLNDVPEFRAN